MSKPDDNGGGVERVSVPHLTLTFDPRNYRVTIGGSVPNLEFAKYLLQTAMDTTEHQIRQRDAKQIVEAHMGPDLLNLRG